jgi:hypothetical protein
MPTPSAPRSRTRPSDGDFAALALRVHIRAAFLCVGEGFLMPRVNGHAPPVYGHCPSIFGVLDSEDGFDFTFIHNQA